MLLWRQQSSFSVSLTQVDCVVELQLSTQQFNFTHFVKVGKKERHESFSATLIFSALLFSSCLRARESFPASICDLWLPQQQQSTVSPEQSIHLLSSPSCASIYSSQANITQTRLLNEWTTGARFVLYLLFLYLFSHSFSLLSSQKLPVLVAW